MRVLMLNYEYPPVGGGAANANYYFLKELTKKNIAVDLVTSAPEGDMVEQFSEQITIYRLDVGKKNMHYWTFFELLRWSLRAYKKTRLLIKKNHYDVCHAWFGWPSGVLAYRCRRHMPYLVALRGSDVPGYNVRLQFIDPLLRFISRPVWKNAAVVTVLSKDLERLANKTLQRKYELVYNGIDTKEFYPGKKVKGFRVLYVGRLIERKGLKYALEAFKKIQKKYPKKDVSFTIVGEGNQLDELKAKAGLNVEFKGRVPHKDLPELYRQHNIFLLPSLEEALGNVTQEAMACGLAIITTKTGAAEIADALIVRKKDTNDIADKLETFINNPTLLRKQGKSNANRAKKMVWPSVAETYLDIYKRIA